MAALGHIDSSLPTTTETPTRNPIKMSTMISQFQKQALIDNLQLEITERARKLRAQYALQAQGLRTRVELRVNRIPTSLRKAKMGELLQKHTEQQKKDQEPKPAVKPAAKPTTGKPLPRPPTAIEIKVPPPSNPTRTRGIKRTSDAFSADKENEPIPNDTSSSSNPIPNPKKRTKTTTTTVPPSRKTTNPSTILSPKSSNSRFLPHSPIRPPPSPSKQPLTHQPPSPSKAMPPPPPPKPTSPAKAAAVAATSSLASLVSEKLKPASARTAAVGRKASKPVGSEPTRAPVTRAKRGAAAATAVPTIPEVRAVSSASNVSGTSSGTTIAKKGARAPPDTKKAAVGISAAGRKVAAKVEAPAAGRRVLRKRN